MNEPKESGQVAVVKIPVLRVGDTSKVSVVRVHTKDGSATSGEDYHPISEGRSVFLFFLNQGSICFRFATKTFLILIFLGRNCVQRG